MKFIKQIAGIIGKGLQILSGFSPAISQLNPKSEPVLEKAKDTLTKLAEIFVNIQVAGDAVGMTDADKLAAIVPLAGKIFRESELLIGHKLSDEKLAAFNAKVKSASSELVDLINLFEANVKTG